MLNCVKRLLVHQRPVVDILRRKKSFTVCVEGNIGSGKTTFLEYFKKFSNVIEVNDEPVQKWREFEGHNPLAHIYENPTRWSYTVQSFIMLTLLELHMKPQTHPVRLMARSMFSSRYCFVENQYKNKLMGEMEYLMLSKWFDWLVNKNDFNIDLIVYLQTKPEEVYERIMARQRPEEQAIQLTYLQDLHNLHEKWLIERKSFPVPAPVLVVDANKDRATMQKTFHNLKSVILSGYDPGVYLQTKPEEVYERIMARQRPEEQAIQLTYLQDLHNRHEKWLIERKSFPVPAPVLVVDANKDRATMQKTFHNLKSVILSGYDPGGISFCKNEL